MLPAAADLRTEVDVLRQQVYLAKNTTMGGHARARAHSLSDSAMVNHTLARTGSRTPATAPTYEMHRQQRALGAPMISLGQAMPAPNGEPFAEPPPYVAASSMRRRIAVRGSMHAVRDSATSFGESGGEAQRSAALTVTCQVPPSQLPPSRGQRTHAASTRSVRGHVSDPSSTARDLLPPRQLAHIRTSCGTASAH